MRLQFRDSPRHLHPVSTRDLLPEDRVSDDQPQPQRDEGKEDDMTLGSPMMVAGKDIDPQNGAQLVASFPVEGGYAYYTMQDAGAYQVYRIPAAKMDMGRGNTGSGMSQDRAPAPGADPRIAAINRANRKAWRR